MAGNLRQAKLRDWEGRGGWLLGQTVEGGWGFVILLHLEISTGGQPR